MSHLLTSSFSTSLPASPISHFLPLQVSFYFMSTPPLTLIPVVGHSMFENPLSSVFFAITMSFTIHLSHCGIASFGWCIYYPRYTAWEWARNQTWSLQKAVVPLEDCTSLEKLGDFPNSKSEYGLLYEKAGYRSVLAISLPISALLVRRIDSLFLMMVFCLYIHTIVIMPCTSLHNGCVAHNLNSTCKVVVALSLLDGKRLRPSG